MADPNELKRELRRAMRPARRRAALDPRRSVALVERGAALPELERARVVMLFDPLPGEPDVRPLAVRLRAVGVDVAVPDPEPHAVPPIGPDEADVVVVPGVAFTRDGIRLGQGGGWYDRFLSGVARGCAVIGVCFDEQLVDDLPTGPHDVSMTCVVTPTATFRPAHAHDPGDAAPGPAASAGG